MQEKASIEAEDAGVDVFQEALTALETAESADRADRADQIRNACFEAQSAEVPRQRAELAQKHGVGMDLSQAQQLERSCQVVNHSLLTTASQAQLVNHSLLTTVC